MPKLSLVGAGPGDPELISLKAIRVLASADVVLYDALANAELLNYAKAAKLLVFVGKRKGEHYLSQTAINELILNYGLQYGHVVRLKGGDPFVFGRGYEEIEAAKAAGFEINVVPGISSSLGVLATNILPITHREIAQSFWVVTGHTASGQLPQDLYLAAQSSATVVVLMGMSKLAEIIEIFKQYKNQSYPVAIIQNGTLAVQKIAVGQIDNICQIVSEQDIKNPAIIVFGEVVSLAKEDLLKVIKAEGIV
jgi:uroporphyrin-III C-methyltransferase